MSIQIAGSSGITFPNSTVQTTNGSLINLTAQSTLSGTYVDVTIPSTNAKRCTIMLGGVSTSGSSNLLIQIGDEGGIETTGYTNIGVGIGSGAAAATSTTGFMLGEASVNTYTLYGVFELVRSTSLSPVSYFITGEAYRVANTSIAKTVGHKSLSSGAVKTIRITTVNGTDTFDGGYISVMYEE